MKARPLAALAVPLLTLTFVVASSSTPASAAPSPRANFHAQRVCDPAQTQPGDASCQSLRLVDSSDNPIDPMVTSSGALTPADVRAAYNLTSASCGGKTVAIVDAYGYPKAESDLAVYRSQYGLPACTVATGCLTIVDQNGGSYLPKYNYGWAGEQALDLDAVSATCPDCKILLVQASSASLTDLGTAVNTAARWAGVVAISNSYGGGDLADSSYGS
jgi:subtilase family serine protease